MELFFLRKNDDNNFILQLFVSGWGNTSQICLDPENDKSLWKRDFEKRILYIVRIKIRLNLIRYMNFAINSKLMQDWTVEKAKLSWNIDPFR